MAILFDKNDLRPFLVSNKTAGKMSFLDCLGVRHQGKDPDDLEEMDVDPVWRRKTGDGIIRGPCQVICCDCLA